MQTWLAAGCLPGGLEGLERPAYEQAVATYAVLQEAAAQGLECLEQVRGVQPGWHDAHGGQGVGVRPHHEQY